MGIREDMGRVRHEDYKYQAFVSYSSRDRRWASWLGRALERYRIPKTLVGRTTAAGTVPSRLYPVFVDREELRAGGEVGDALQAALMASRVLIVICSPSAAAPSSWVSREIAYFKAAGRESDVLALIVDGEPHASGVPGREAEECFPRPLRFRVDEHGRLTDEPADPLAADVRREDSRPREARRKALLKLVARMIDVDFDALEGRDRRRRRRRAIGWTTAAMVVMAALAISAAVSVRQSREALSQRLAEAAAASTPQTDRALLLAAAAYEADPTPAAHQSLIGTVASNPHLARYVHRARAVQDAAFSPDGSTLAVASCDGRCPASAVSFYQVEASAPRGPSIGLPGEVTHLRFQDARRLLVAYRDAGMHSVVALDPDRPDAEPTPVFRTNEAIAALAVSGDGHRYGVTTEAETKIFDHRAGALHCVVDTGPRVVATALAPDGQAFAAAVDRGGLSVMWARLEDRVSSACRANRELFPSQPSDIAFDATGRELYVAGRDGVVLRRRLDGSPGPDRDMFSVTEYSAEGYRHWLGAGGRYLLSHFGDHVRAYDIARRAEIADALSEARREERSSYEIDALQRALHSVEAARFHHTAPVRAVLDRQGRNAATIEEPGVVRLWTFARHPIVSTREEFSPVEADILEAASRDGRFSVTAAPRSEGCTGDYTELCQTWTELRLFDARRGVEIDAVHGPRRRDPASGPLAVGYAEDGRVLVRRETVTEAWTLAPEALLDVACGIANRNLTAEEIVQAVPAWRLRALRPASPCAAR